MIGLMVVVANWSKSRQKVEKSAKAIGLEEPSFLTFDTRLALIKINKSYDKELLALLEAFKNWEPY